MEEYRWCRKEDAGGGQETGNQFGVHGLQPSLFQHRPVNSSITNSAMEPHPLICYNLGGVKVKMQLASSSASRQFEGTR